MHDTSVSVIIPVYNGERYLAAAIESVLEQDYKPLEIIVVDDGSTDKSAQVAHQFDWHVQYVLDRHSGPGQARNTGINLARGELLAFLDADDLWLPGKLNIQVRYLMDHSQCPGCLTRIKYFLEPGFSLPKTFKKELLDEELDGYLIQTLVCRRNIFDVVGKFDANLPSAEDTDWFIRAKDRNVLLAMMPEVLLYKRIHGTNITLDVNLIQQNFFKALKKSVERKKLLMQNG